MSGNIWQSSARFLRTLVGIGAALLLLWSVLWVATRPWRRARLAPGQVQLTVLHWGEDTEDAIVAKLVEEFEREHPHIKIRRINPGTSEAVNTKFSTMAAAGEPPDIFYLGYEKVSDFASKGLVASIEPFLEAERERDRSDRLEVDDFYPTVLDCFRFDGVVNGRGTLYGLPKDYSTVGFYYNKDLFARAGLAEPPDDWTWDEFIETARRVAELDGVYGAEFTTWEAMVRVYLWTAGLDFASPDFSQFYLDDPEVRAALERLRSWFQDEPRTFAGARSRAEVGEDLFLSGRVGMSGPYGRWKVPIFREIEDFDWDFAPLPRGKVRVNAIFSTAWAISSRTQHPQEAWEFVRFLSSAKGQRLNSLPGLAIPAMRNVAESDAFTDPGVKPTRDYVYLAATEHARPVFWPANPKYVYQLRARLEDILKAGSKTVAEGLDLLQAEWESNRREAGLRRNYPRMPWGWVATAILTPGGLLILLAAWRWWHRRPERLAFREELAGVATISPWVIGFVAFAAFPIVLSLLLSFTRWSGLATLGYAEWVGLGNFRHMLFHDPRLARSLWVTAYYVLLAVPIGQLAALAAALLVSREVRGIGIFRSVWYLPSVLAGVGIAVLWRWVFHADHGLLNALLAPLLGRLGSDPPGWFTTDAETWGVPAFVIMSLWTIGASMMIYLAGLKGISPTLYEAAEIDGATRLARFRSVTLPMLSPVIFFNVIIAIIASFQVFTQAYVMTAGGPGDATRFYVLYLYNEAFDYHEMGYASAMAWLLLVIVLLLTLVVMRGSRRFVYYEALRG